MGRGQAVRRGTLDPVFGGSNPPAPATLEAQHTGMSRGQLKLFSGSAHRALATEIGEFLGVQLGQARLQRFPDTEVSFQIDENIRGTDVFVVQPTCAPVDEHLVELCVMMDAFRRSSASRITAVIPYYGYARQDRKDKPRVPISAKLVANLLSAAGANRVLCMDLHKAQIQGFFDIPVDHLFAAPVIIEYCSRLGMPNLTIVSPDAGGAERARAYAKRLDAELAIIDKRRSDDGTAEVMNVVGDVAGRTCIIQDDIIDTAGTIVKAAIALKENGAERVIACAVHGVLSGPAIERLEGAPIEQVVITNTIPLHSDRARSCTKIKQLSVARLLGQAIRSINEETSVSSLFV
jgi:ribose-phosphate pyrophosphokinase